jgi:hypothetical protein
MAGGAVQGMRLADTIAARAQRKYLVAAMAAFRCRLQTSRSTRRPQISIRPAFPAAWARRWANSLEQLPDQQQSRTRALLTPERVTEFLPSPRYPSAAVAAPNPR